MTIQEGSSLRQQAAVVQNAQSNHNKGINTMNTTNLTAAQARVKFNQGEYAALVGLHHATIKKAMGCEENLRILANNLVIKGLDCPEWLMAYYTEAPAAVAQAVDTVVKGIAIVAPTINTPETRKPTGSVPHTLVMSVNCPITNLFKPLVDGKTYGEWTQHVISTELKRKDGTAYNALYATAKLANRAISNANRRLYGGYLAGVLTEDQFKTSVEAIQDRFSGAAQGVAAVKKINSPTTGAEIMEITMRTKDHGADAKSEDPLVEVNQMIEELNYSIQTGGLREGDLELGIELLQRKQAIISARMMKEGESDHKDWVDSDAKNTNDTGVITAAVESMDHLLSLDPRDIFGAEEEAIRALWAAKGLAVPDYQGDLRDRLLDKWSNAIDYARGDAKAETKNKIAKRMKCLAEGLDATVEVVSKHTGETYNKSLATYMRWTVNHVTRSLWRDIKRLEMAALDHQRRLDVVEERARIEELQHDGLNDVTGASCPLTRQPMGETQVLGYEISHPFCRTIGDDDLPQQVPEIVRQRALHTMAIAAIDEALIKVRQFYAEWRELDLAHTPIWKTFASEEIPMEQPPIYWNNRGWYMTEEDARKAFLTEIAEAAQQRLALDATNIADHLGSLLGQETFTL